MIGVAVHTPLVQVEVVSQALLPGAHAVPSTAFGLEQLPEEGSHVPATWQASSAVHTTPAQRSEPLEPLLPLALPTLVEPLLPLALPTLVDPLLPLEPVVLLELLL